MKGTTPAGKPAAAIAFTGPINSIVEKVGNGINRLSGGQPLYTVVDPTRADPRLAATRLTPRARSFPST